MKSLGSQNINTSPLSDGLGIYMDSPGLSKPGGFARVGEGMSRAKRDEWTRREFVTSRERIVLILPLSIGSIDSGIDYYWPNQLSDVDRRLGEPDAKEIEHQHLHPV